MATRVVEGKKPYTGGKAISIDENKVISLNLRDENNLIIYDEGDDEIYVDLQLDDEITPTDAFPIGVNVGRVIVDNGWDLPGTIISAVTTSGDNIKIFYADEGTLWIDNGTGTFKQIYFKADVDALLLALRNYIDGELAKKQNGVSSDTAPSNPSEGDLWYDTTSNSMKVWDGTAWQSVGGGDVLVSDQANNIFTPGMKIWGGTESDYQSLTPDSNTAYLLLAGGPTPPSPRQPGANTIAYYPLTSVTTTIDMGGNNNLDLTNNGGVTFGINAGVDCASINSSQRNALSNQDNIWTTLVGSQSFTYCLWIYVDSFASGENGIMAINNASGNEDRALAIMTDYTVRGYIADGNVRFAYTPVISTGQWYLLTLTQDGNNNLMSIYLNGSLSQSTSCNGSTETSINILGIGPAYPGNSSIHGYVSNVIVEDKAWTSQEIQDYFNQTKANYGIS